MANGIKISNERGGFSPRMQRAISKGIAAIGTVIAVEAQKSVNRSNLQGTAPSKQGNPPRKRTGHGQRGIIHRHNRASLTSRVGWTKNADYMFFHEVGIRYRRVGIQKRAHVEPAARKNKDKLARAFRRGFKVAFG